MQQASLQRWAIFRTCLHSMRTETTDKSWDIAKSCGNGVVHMCHVCAENDVVEPLAPAGLAVWLTWAWLQKQVDVSKKKAAAVALQDMTGADLKRICGNVRTTCPLVIQRTPPHEGGLRVHNWRQHEGWLSAQLAADRNGEYWGLLACVRRRQLL